MTQLTKAHIETLVRNFYQKVQADELLSPIFNDVAQVNWEHHIPLLCQFWNSIMLKTNEYHGGAYMKHLAIGEKTPIKEEHFARWLEIFRQQAAIDLPAAAAEQIILRASLIAQSLKLGMLDAVNKS